MTNASSDMQSLLNNSLTLVVLSENSKANDAWITAISVIAGALIGGIFPCLITYYTFKKEREKEIILRKTTLLDEAATKLLIPLTDFRSRLNSVNSSDAINDLLIHLRQNRKYFVYCPNNIRRRINDLYTNIEEKKAKLNSQEILNVIEDINRIEDEFYSTFIELKF